MNTLLSSTLLCRAPALQSARTDKMRIKSEKSLTALMEEHLVSEAASVAANAALQSLLRVAPHSAWAILSFTLPEQMAGAVLHKMSVQVMPWLQSFRALQGNICGAPTLKALMSDTDVNYIRKNARWRVHLCPAACRPLCSALPPRGGGSSLDLAPQSCRAITRCRKG